MKIVFFIFFKGSGEFFTINNGLKYKAEGQKAGCCILWKLYKLVIPSGNMFHVQRRPYRTRSMYVVERKKNSVQCKFFYEKLGFYIFH